MCWTCAEHGTMCTCQQLPHLICTCHQQFITLSHSAPPKKPLTYCAHASTARNRLTWRTLDILDSSQHLIFPCPHAKPCTTHGLVFQAYNASQFEPTQLALIACLCPTCPCLCCLTQLCMGLPPSMGPIDHRLHISRICVLLWCARAREYKGY